MIVAPESFFDFCIRLHQDSFILYGPEPIDCIKGASHGLNPVKRKELKLFLDQMLDGRYSASEIHQLYLSSDADIRFDQPEGTKWFFSLLRDMLSHELG